jgi:hypothetical protein
MRRDCLITARLAGPCACCRQPAWPVHAQSDGRILCATCCGCVRGGAQAPGRDAAGPGHEAGPVMRHEAGPRLEALAADRGPAENRPRTGLPAGAGASLAWGKAPDTTQGPARDSGALEALRGASCGPACPALRPQAGAADAAAPPRGRPRGPRPGRRAGVALAGPASQGQAQVHAALRGKTILRQNVSAHNFVKQWRFT